MLDKGGVSQPSGPKTIPDMSNLKRENTFGSQFGKFQCLVGELVAVRFMVRDKVTGV